MEPALASLFGLTSIFRDVAFVVCTMLIASFRPQRIQSPGLFKLACFLWAVSTVAPFVLSLGVGVLDGSFRGNVYGGGGAMSFMMLIQLVGPTLFGAAFVCAIISIVGNGYFPDPKDE